VDNKYDIFISCTAENKPEIIGWAADFRLLLKDVLDRILKRETNILTSTQLLNDKDFTSVAPVEIFSKTAAFVVILDDSYASSTKSVQELATILSVIQKDMSGKKADHRIFKILVSDLKKAAQPEYVRNLLPYRFFTKNDSTVAPVDFTKNTEYNDLREYRLRLVDLAYNISYNIRSTSVKTNKTVFLAETGADQVFNREIIKRELMHYGYNVLPDNQLPEDKSLLEKYILECLGFSNLAVHIFGSVEGTLVQGTNQSLAEFQNVLGAKYCKESKGKIKRLIWIPPDLLFEEETQRINIEKLKRNSEELQGAELVQTPIEEFKSIIHRVILNQSANPKAGSEVTEGLITYVMYEPKHKIHAEKVMSLLSKSGININQLDEYIEKQSMISKHRENMATCDGIVIVTDNPESQWTQSKMNDVLKSLGFGRKKLFKAKAMVTINKNENFQFSNDYFVVNGINGNYEDVMKPLIEKLMN